MHAEYSVTVGEASEAVWLWTRRSKPGRAAWRRAVFVAGGAAAGAAAYVLASNDMGLMVSAAGALAAGVAVGGVWALVYAPLTRWQIRKYMQDLLPDAPSRHFRVELRPSALWTRQGSTEIAYEWGHVQRIEETARGIEIWMPDGLVLVRTRAFADRRAADEFANEARALATTAGSKD